MITTLSWIPRGAARNRPVRFELSNAEYSRVKELAKAEQDETEKADTVEYNAPGLQTQATGDESGSDDGDNDDQPQKKSTELDASGLPAELKMDQYDDDDAELDGGAVMAMDQDEDDDDAFELLDPDADLPIAYGDVEDDEWEDEDQEDHEVRTTDSLLAVAMTEDEYSHLEVQLFSQEGNLYVHHDILLPDMAICLAWMDVPPFPAPDGGQSLVGNFMAVGTFSTPIEIWNLDVLDPIEPTAVLGGPVNNDGVGAGGGSKKKSKKGKKASGKVEGSHEAAVMSLSWNSVYRPALASGSADTTVKIWDVTTQQCSHTFRHHRDKVQSVLWHSQEAWLLGTGSFDKTISLIDARSATHTFCAGCPLAVDGAGDLESMLWDPFNPFHLYVSMESGEVACIDIRNAGVGGGGAAAATAGKSTVFQFQAHERTTSAISFSSRVPGMLTTASIDKTVKIWDVSSASTSGIPHLVAYKSMNAGKLFTMQCNPDDPFLLAAGGDKGILAVWESDEQEVVLNHFKDKIMPSKSPYTNLSDAGSKSGEQLQNANVAIKASAAPAVGSAAVATLGLVAAAGTTPGKVDGDVTAALTGFHEDESWMESTNADPGAAARGDKNNNKKKNKKNSDKKKSKK